MAAVRNLEELEGEIVRILERTPEGLRPDELYAFTEENARSQGLTIDDFGALLDRMWIPRQLIARTGDVYQAWSERA